MNKSQLFTRPDFASPTGITRWPTMIPRGERLCWQHSARSFTFAWDVPADSIRPVEVRLCGVSVVIEVLAGGFALRHGERSYVIPAGHAVAISAHRFLLAPGDADASVLVHVIRTLPDEKSYLSSDPGNRLSPWWKLLKFAGQQPGIFPLGVHRYARGCAKPASHPLLGEQMLMACSAFAFVSGAQAEGFFAFLASHLLHRQIIEQLRAGVPQRHRDWFEPDPE